jgi:hypothetical protein
VIPKGHVGIDYEYDGVVGKLGSWAVRKPRHKPPRLVERGIVAGDIARLVQICL